MPFHINAIKNVSKNDEGEFTFLRINFQTPGKLAGKKEDTVRLSLKYTLIKADRVVISRSKILMRRSSDH